jgi:DNA modification methylase
MSLIKAANGKVNDLAPEDRSIHDWYRFVLSFPPHLVRHYLERFGVTPDQTVLDPFCGTGTTLVECKKLGIGSIGVEANPVAYFASKVKTDWSPDPTGLLLHAQSIASATHEELLTLGIEDLFVKGHSHGNLRKLPPQAEKLLLTDSISPLPLHKALTLIAQMEKMSDAAYSAHERLALAQSAVNAFSNLRFGPEVGLGTIKKDAPVVAPWLAAVQRMTADLRQIDKHRSKQSDVHLADARDPMLMIPSHSIDAVITSPPYPNEKDYTRITRLEAVLLGFLHDRAELQALKRSLVRSNTRTVYKGDSDDLWIDKIDSIQRLAAEIESRRIDLGKTSGFEKLYAKVTRLYFGGMARHLAELRRLLLPGAYLAYVVGDQASYFRVMIRTASLLAEVAERLGYTVVDVDLFRTRMATATGEQLREEILILQWKGSHL